MENFIFCAVYSVDEKNPYKVRAVLTQPVPIPVEERKINLNFYFFKSENKDLN